MTEADTIQYLIGFGAGCTAAYFFCMQTFMKNARERISERDITIMQLTARVDELDRMMYRYTMLGNANMLSHFNTNDHDRTD